jgi:hypothetical protein
MYIPEQWDRLVRECETRYWGNKEPPAPIMTLDQLNATHQAAVELKKQLYVKITISSQSSLETLKSTLENPLVNGYFHIVHLHLAGLHLNEKTLHAFMKLAPRLLSIFSSTLLSESESFSMPIVSNCSLYMDGCTLPPGLKVAAQNVFINNAPQLVRLSCNVARNVFVEEAPNLLEVEAPSAVDFGINRRQKTPLKLKRLLVLSYANEIDVTRMHDLEKLDASRATKVVGVPFLNGRLKVIGPRLQAPTDPIEIAGLACWVVINCFVVNFLLNLDSTASIQNIALTIIAGVCVVVVNKYVIEKEILPKVTRIYTTGWHPFYPIKHRLF